MQRAILPIITTDTNNGITQNSKSIADFADWIDCNLDVVTDTQPRICKAEIVLEATNVGGTTFAQGELKLSTKNFGAEVFAKINQKGELQIFGNNADRYYINSQGFLIYKYCPQ